MLEAIDGGFQLFPLFFLGGQQHQHQVCADAEVLALVGDDHGFEVLGSLFDAGTDQGDLVVAQRVHLAVELEQVEVFVARTGVAGNLIEGFRAGREHFLDILRNLALLLAHARDGFFDAQRVPQLEGAERIDVAPAHGTVDFDDAIGNLRHHAGRVQHQIAEEPPQERAGTIRQGH